jgi:hypothetical protein
LVSGAGIALSGRERERSNARSGEDIHGGLGQAVERHPVRRAPEPRHLGRIGRRHRHGHTNVFPAQGVSGSREPRLHLRAVNYILGTHPVSSTSYVAGVGTVSKTKTYSNNRADNAYIPGAVIPGYIIIKPDFPECIDDFGFLWFEDEAVVAGSASWVVAGNAADAITRESK